MSATAAARAIKQEISRLKGLQLAADYLEELGAIENAIEEASGREREIVEKLDKQLSGVKKELSDLNLQIMKDEQARRKAVAEAKEKARKVLSDADLRASAITKNALDSAKQVIDSAELKSKQVRDASDKSLRDSEQYKQDLSAEIEVLIESKNSLTNETENLEKRLAKETKSLEERYAKVKMQIAKLTED